MMPDDCVDLLLVEDNPGDIRLTRESLKEWGIPNRLHVVEDGLEALAFLRREGSYADAPRPQLILLDLNLPKMNGHRVLEEIKKDPDLRQIPVLILSTSSADLDIFHAYDNHANCYITKPLQYNQFGRVIDAIGQFWAQIAKLPTGRNDGL
jgi:two-component system, chemotaxis family, response regulator Rcp1